MKTSRLTVKGQITVPKEYRDSLCWPAHTELQFEPVPGGVKLTKPSQPSQKGRQIVEKLRGEGNRKMTTAQIMALTRGEP